MKTVILFVGAWVTGLVSYVVSCRLFYGQAISLSSADFRSVASISFIAFAVTFCTVYLPALFLLRRVLRGVCPAWPFPVVATILGMLPTALVLFHWGGTVRSFLSAEALLFYSMFGAVGLVVGVGFTMINRDNKET